MPELLKVQELSGLFSNPPFWIGLVVTLQAGALEVLFLMLVGHLTKHD